MQAFEFQTTTQDGFIRIPDRFKGKMTPNIKVIILSGEQEKPKKAPFIVCVSAFGVYYSHTPTTKQY